MVACSGAVEGIGQTCMSSWLTAGKPVHFSTRSEMLAIVASWYLGMNVPKLLRICRCCVLVSVNLTVAICDLSS